MKLLDGNIRFYRHCRKEVCYYDLLSGAIIDDGPNVYDVPKVVTLEGWEFIKYEMCIRDSLIFGINYHLAF